MKRELDYELGGSLGEPSTQSLTRVESQASDCLKGVCENVSCKRFRVTKVNGFIVYTRVKKSCFNNSDDLLENNVNDKRINSFREIKVNEDQSYQMLGNVIKENGMVESVIEENRVLENAMQENHEVVVGKSTLVKTLLEESLVADTVMKDTRVVENLIEEVPVLETVKASKSSCSLDVPMCKEEPFIELKCSRGKGEGSEGTPLVITESSGVINDSNKKDRKLLRQLSAKLKVEPVEVLVTQAEDFGNEAMSLIEVEAIAEGSALTSPRKNLELKMSKKIALNKKPMTVTELFETGLLDGVSVVYMGGIKVTFFYTQIFYFILLLIVFILAYSDDWA